VPTQGTELAEALSYWPEAEILSILGLSCTVPWRVEVRPLASGHLVGAHHLFVHRSEADRMRLRMGRRDFFCAGFESLQTARYVASQFCLLAECGRVQNVVVGRVVTKTWTSPVYVVRTMIRALGNSLRMPMIAPIPFSAGIWRSINVTSGRCNRNFSIASRPLQASATSFMSVSALTSAAIPSRRRVVVDGQDPNHKVPASSVADYTD
jgi:hypothetical protein